MEMFVLSACPQGVQYRKFKNLDDKTEGSQFLAEDGQTVEGTLEDGGNWLRLRNGCYLPTRLMGKDILLPTFKGFVDNQVENIRALLIELYKVHNPSKLIAVDDFLARSRGIELTLYKGICAKYKVKPKDYYPVAAVSIPDTASTTSSRISWVSTERSTSSGMLS